MPSLDEERDRVLLEKLGLYDEYQAIHAELRELLRVVGFFLAELGSHKV